MTLEIIPDDGQLIRPDIDMLHPSPTNPRTRFAEGPLAELAADIKAQGVIQPILARIMPAAMRERLGTSAELEIVAGERRWRASKMAGLTDVPVLLRDLDDATVIRMQIAENLHRKDLSAIEEAEGYARLANEGLSVQQIADQVSKSKAYVYAKLKLLALDGEAREIIIDRDIHESIALLVARIPVANMQLDALDAVTKPDEYTGEPMSFRAAKRWISENYTKNLTKAPFDSTDGSLTDAGSCQTCLHRLGNSEDCPAGSENVCTSPPCYELKRQAYNVRMLNLPPTTPRVDIPKYEGTAGPTNWTDLDAAGYRQLSSTYHNDPLKRSYADWLRDNGEHIPIAVHVCQVTGNALAVVRIDDLIKASNRIAQKEAATAEQPHLGAVIEETEQTPPKAPTPAAAKPVALVTLPPTLSSKPKQDEQALSMVRYRASLQSAIMAEPPMMIAGPMLDVVARALLDDDTYYMDSDGEAMQAILAALIKRSESKPVCGSDGIEGIAKALGINYAELRAKHLPEATDTPRTSKVRYRHPENPAIAWSGHGRKPQWVIHWIDNGGALEDLENPDFTEKAA